MLTWFRSFARHPLKATELYGVVVARARTPAFYANGGILDTAEGRYELIVLHLFLVMERLRAEGGRADEISRKLVEAFVTDMDDNLREMGVGDLTVPKKVKQAAAGFYGRTHNYRKAIGEGDDALVIALQKIIPGLGAGAERLAAYVRVASHHLSGFALEDIVAGRITFSPQSAAATGCSHEGEVL